MVGFVETRQRRTSTQPEIFQGQGLILESEDMYAIFQIFQKKRKVKKDKLFENLGKNV